MELATENFSAGGSRLFNGSLSNRAMNEVFTIVDECSKIHSLLSFSEIILHRTHQLLGQEMTACGIAKVSTHKIHSTLNAGFPPDFLAAIVDSKGHCISPMFYRWIQRQVPQVFESKTCNNLKVDEAGLYHGFELSSVLSNGLLDMEGRYTTYFGFAQIQDKIGPYQLSLIDLLTPHLHVAYSRISREHGDLREAEASDHQSPIATSLKSSLSNVDNNIAKKCSKPLSAREHEVLQWLLGGKSNWDVTTQRVVKIKGNCSDYR